MKFNIYIFIISRVGATMVFAPFCRLCRQLTVVGKPIIRYESKGDGSFASTITCDNYLFENILKTREL